MKRSSEQSYWCAKLKRLKRDIKQQIFINAALYDEVGRMEQQFVQSKAERKLLMKRLFQYLPMSESHILQTAQAQKSSESCFTGKFPQTMHSVKDSKEVGTSVFKKRTKKFPASETPEISTEKTNSPVPIVSDGKQSIVESGKSKEKAEGSGTKPKRKKPGTAPKKVHSLQLDMSGVPIFPIPLGTLSVYDLGEVVHDRPGFHSERYIWPVGFSSTRIYPSMINPDNRIQYFCNIKDGGSEPVFEIIAEDEPNNPITAVTATACHCHVLKRLNKRRGKEATNTGSGPEFFGFSHSTIQYLIQSLPGANKCKKYLRLQFEFPTLSPSGVANQESFSGNVLHEDNLPRMHLYDRKRLALPQREVKT